MENIIVTQIYSESELRKAVDFLKIGFKQSDLFASKLLSHSIKTNKNNNLFGFSIKENGIICGAILTLFQGNFKTEEGKLIPIINLSTWYIKPHLRGLHSINHIYKSVQYFKEFIITNYTPRESTLPIFKMLGFKYMKSFLYRKYRPSLKQIFNKIKIEINRINYSDIKDKLPYVKLNLFNDVIYFKVKVDMEEEFYFAAVMKKLLVRKIFIPSLYILWTSNEKQIFKYFDKLHFKLAIDYKFLSMFIYSNENFIEKYKINSKYSRKAPFLIKSSEQIEYIEPIGSELCIGIT